MGGCITDSQTQVGVGLLQDPVRVKVGGGQVLSPADDGVDLLRQFFGFLFELLMLLHTPQTVSRSGEDHLGSRRVQQQQQQQLYLEKLPAGSQVVASGGAV